MRRLLVALALGLALTPAALGSPRVRVVGSVQDGGLPHVACRCDTCERAREPGVTPRLVSAVAILTQEEGRSHVSLIDATPDLPRQLELLRDVRKAPPGRVDRTPLDAIFLTHAHLGHYTGLAALGFEAVHAQAVPVYATASMGGFLRANGPWSQLVRLRNIVVHDLVAPVALPGGVDVTALRVPHRDEYADTVGFLIEGPTRTVLFVPDTDSWEHWDPPLEEVLRTRDVDVALLDGTFYSQDELPGRAVESIGHPLITDSMDRLQAWVDAGREIWFIHLNHSNPGLDDGSDAQRTIQGRGFRVAREGDEVTLGP